MADDMRSTSPLVRVRKVFPQLGMSDNAGYRAIENGTFPLEVLQIGGIQKCRKSDLKRLLDGSAAD